MSNLTPAQQEMYNIANAVVTQKIDDIEGGCCVLMLAFLGIAFITVSVVPPVAFYLQRGHF